jgi:ATP-dependent DNA ligase
VTEGSAAHAGRDTARRVIPLFRPYRLQVAFVVGLIVLTYQELLRHGGLYEALYEEQFDGGRVQWRCSDGDVLADGSVRQRVA